MPDQTSPDDASHQDAAADDASAKDDAEADEAAPKEATPEDAPLTRHDTMAAQRRAGRLRRTLGLTALGTLLPGAGLALGARRRRIGQVLVAVALLTGIALVVYVVRHGALRSALDLAARPGLLRGLAVVIVIGGLVWMGSIVLTTVSNRPASMTTTQRSGLIAFTAAMCLVVAAPTGLGLRYIGAHNSAVDKIFTGKPTRNVPTPATPGGVTGPNLQEPDPWAGVPRVNVLMLGSDAGDDREGVRTDSMIVASIDTKSGDTVLFSIPRNLEMVPIPQSSPLAKVWPKGYNCGDACLMNGIWTEATVLAKDHPDWFQGDRTPGETATRDVIGEILGLPIDYTLIVDLKGFKELVDAMGGVDIDVQERVPIGGRTVTDGQGRSYLVKGSEAGWIETGPQHLSGYRALWYARSRVTTDDFSRMRRQRCVVAAVVQQVDPLTLLRHYPDILRVAGDNITIDISQDELPAWADLVSRVQGGTIKSLPFTVQNTNVVDPDFAKIHRQVRAALRPAPSTTKPTATTGDDATGTTGPTKPRPTKPGTTSDSSTTTEPTDELSDVGAVC